MSERFGNYADGFNGSSLNARWTVFAGSPIVSGGAMIATADFDMSAGADFPTSGHVPGSFTGKYVTQFFRTSPNNYSWFYVNTFPYVSFLGFDIFGGNIELSSSFGGASIWTDTYDPDVHQGLRIREDAGTMYAEYWDGEEWIEVYSEPTQAWVSGSVADSQGGGPDGSPGPGEDVRFFSYNMFEPDTELLDAWCPAGASDPESSDPADLGDFEEPITPPFTSQKNIVDVAFDPRTGTLLRSQGGFGSFGESPPTDMQLSTSQTCGRTWTTPVNFAPFLGSSYQAAPFNVTNIPSFFNVPVSLIPGANPGEWLAFDYVGGFYKSVDNGLTFSARQLSGIAPFQSGPNGIYYGLVGVDGSFNTRALTLQHYLEVQQIGYSFMLTVPFRVGVRRAIGANGVGGWENSLAPTDLASGGSGWAPGVTPPVIAGANNRWIVAVGWQETFGENDETFEEEIVPPMRINTSANLAPGNWGAPFYPVSQAWVEDMYGGFKQGGSYGNIWLKFELGHGRLKFTPLEGHPFGGRWWLMGMQDSLIYSDNNGVTWSNSLADHTGPEALMHPILNWRASHALGYRYTPSMITDIVSDPLGSGRLIAIGVTYNRAGISNRLAVYSCSVDGGDTWGQPGQLAVRLSNITSGGASPDFDSPALARHIFPCLFND